MAALLLPIPSYISVSSAVPRRVPCSFLCLRPNCGQVSTQPVFFGNVPAPLWVGRPAVSAAQGLFCKPDSLHPVVFLFFCVCRFLGVGRTLILVSCHSYKDIHPVSVPSQRRVPLTHFSVQLPDDDAFPPLKLRSSSFDCGTCDLIEGS